MLRSSSRIPLLVMWPPKPKGGRWISGPQEPRGRIARLAEEEFAGPAGADRAVAALDGFH